MESQNRKFGEIPGRVSEYATGNNQQRITMQSQLMAAVVGEPDPRLQPPKTCTESAHALPVLAVDVDVAIDRAVESIDAGIVVSQVHRAVSGD